MNMRGIDHDHAFARPTAAAFVPGAGYVSLGDPPMPAHRIFPTERCSPPLDTPDRSVHELWSPDKAKVIKFAWMRSIRTWQVLQLGVANRLGFTPSYLAAYGWSYKGPA
jgi:hypothetical protein